MTHLVPMTQVEYEKFLDFMVTDYANEKVKSGNWPADKAIELSKGEFQRLLPEGVDSKDQHLFSIVDGEQHVGAIWFAVRSGESGKQSAWIYNLWIEDEFRRKGHASQAMLALEEEVKKVGLDTIGLHVFGHNQSAYALYQKIGYDTTNIVMSKKLGE